MTKKIIFILLCFSSVALGTYIGLNDGSGGLLLPDRTKPVWTVDSETPVEEPNLDYDPNWPYGIGIPTPPFGIDEVYTMYNDPNNQNPALTYYPSDSGGYYTHYIDSSTGTNTGRTFGTKDAPRASIPRNLPAGSIVEIHNGSAENGWGQLNITGSGTEQLPIFVRGVDTPHITIVLYLGSPEESNYIIVEDFKFKRGWIKDALPATENANSHLCVRNCEFDGESTAGSMLGVVTWTAGNTLNNVVLYNNTIHSSGQWDPNLATGDNDYHGTGVNGRVSYLWILDNTYYHLEGDGVQINGTNINDLHHVYIGGNTAYSNKQSGFWTKTASDVIFSQNTVHGMRHSNSADGPGLGFQYDPNRVWFLFNTSYDNKNGIHAGSSNAGGRNEIYYIGNLVYDCQAQGITLHDWAREGKSYKVMMNTIYNCPVGIGPGWYKAYGSIFNNIISNCPVALDMSLNGSYIGSEMDYNLLYAIDSIKWDKTYADLAAFQAGTTQGDNCVEADPLFVNTGTYDFDLQAESPFKSIEESSAIQTVIDRFNTLYGIDISDEIRALRLTGVQQAP